MKKLTLLLLTILLVSCSDRERNCNDFKTGKFEFTQTIDGKKHTSTFTRTEKLQIETYNGKTDTASVRWVNDCEFILQKLHPKNMAEEKAISMKILFTEKNTYTFEYSFVGSNKKERGLVTKLD
ncbi:DNA topoisomerase IV [Flavobacterium sp.]